MVDFNNYMLNNVFFPKSISPEWNCKVKIFDKGTFSEIKPYTIEMTSSKVKSVTGILPITTNYLKYSVFNIIAGMDGNSENITMSDLAKLKKQFKNKNEISPVKNLGVTNVKWDGNAGKGTIEFNYREVVVIDFETAAEAQKKSSEVKKNKVSSMNNDMDYDGFIQDLALSESSGSYTKVNNLNYLGRYQFGESALMDIGMYEKTGDCNNDWKGVFILPGKNGKTKRVKGKEAFLNSPAAQEIALDKYMKKQWYYVNDHYKITKYIGNKNIEKYCGCSITNSGLIAAAHLRGAKRLSEFFEELDKKGRIKDMSKYCDKNGKSVIDYMKKFAGYNLKEITRPS